MRMASRALVTVGAAALGLAVWRANAWMTDDAWITFRVVEHAATGLGLRYNPAERVQVSTHPAWLLLLLGGRLATGAAVWEVARWASLACVAVASIAGTLAVRDRGPGAVAVLAAWALTARTLVHATSGGLAGPLLLAATATALAATLGPTTRPRVAAAALGVLLATRLDTAPVALPVLGVLLAAHPRARGALAALTLGPVAAWLLFAAAYFGSPWPNPTYAKLPSNVDALARATDGLDYVTASLRTDPTAAAALVAGVAIGLRAGGTARAWAVGAVLSVAGTIAVGGDWIVARFLVVPVLVGAVLAARAAAGWGPAASVAGIMTLATLALPGAPLRALWTVDDPLLHGEDRTWDLHAMVRRRGGDPWAPDAPPARPAVDLLVIPDVGMQGWHAGPDVHVVDVLGLTDPLLARLPATASWPGHHTRVVPAGYLAWLRGEAPGLVDPALDAFHRDLVLLTRGPIGGPGWAAACWRRNIAATTFRAVDQRATPLPHDPRDDDATCLRVDAATLGPPVPPGHPLDQHDVLHGVGCGVAVGLPDAGAPLALHLGGGTRWRWRRLRDGVVVDHGTIDDGQPAIHEVSLPAGPDADTLWLRADGIDAGLAAVIAAPAR